MNNIVSVKLDSRYASTLGVWQYDYGQVLRITGPELPPAVEVQFSLTEKSGETLSRVGTTVDGVTEVKIPDELLTHIATSNYRIYAYIYLTDETSGNTKYEITIPVRVRSKPTSPAEDPETDPDLFRETVVAVNASADRAKMAEQNAKESATEAGKYAASASDSAVTAEKTKEDALRKVGEKKQEAIEAIQNQEETSVGKIIDHTDNEIKRLQNQTADSKAGLEQTITNAGVSKEELDESIQTASDTKTALDKSVELAGTAKTELDTSIREAGTAKTALDESTETAGTVQETLSATVKQAGALDTSLGENIETGTQLKTDLTASGEKAVQDIQAAGSEQLGKMQAVAEEFTADREQIATNKEDIGSLQEDLSNKITKFYASNQGETHLADSDNGKIQDMMIYGKSSQDGTPTPDNPVEIKSVVNPVIKVCGANILNIRNREETVSGKNGLTYSVKNGVIKVKGTATSSIGIEIMQQTANTKLKLKKNNTYIFNPNSKKVEDNNAYLDLTNSRSLGISIKSNNVNKPIKPTEKDVEYLFSLAVRVNQGATIDMEWKPQLLLNESLLPYKPYTEQSVTLPITLNAIPVGSGGNVTIVGQQYIADYVDIERGKLVRMVDSSKLDNTQSIVNKTEWLLAEPQETDLTTEEITAFKALVTNYPVTNISVTSDQLDGYTVFNYPISMANGWNYVKQQLNDNRDYIYDMDIQSAEAYVNSEYAVALTELEV